jgi:hypothetical protein
MSIDEEPSHLGAGGPVDVEKMRAFVADVMAERPLSVQPPIALVKAAHMGPIAYIRGMAELRQEYAASLIMADRRARTLREVLAAFARRSLSAALLKGVSLIGTVYPDPAERPMNDIDLLVRLEQLPIAIEAVTQLGFVRVGMVRKLSDHYHAIAFCRGDMMLELHRNIQQRTRMRMPLGEIWDRTAPDDRGSGALRLERIDELILCMVHASRHELAVPAINFLDVHRLWQGLSLGQRDELLARAQRYRLRRSVTAVLQMTENLAAGRSERPDLGRGSRILPSTDEVLRAAPPARLRQIAQKLLLTEGPREIAGLGYAWGAAMVSGYRIDRSARR